MKRQKYCAMLIALLVLTIHSNLVAADVLDGLIGYWPFDEGRGNVAANMIGGHDGAVKGATWTDDAISGKALKFLPKDDAKVQIEHAEVFDVLPDGFTIANWIKPRSRGAMMDKSNRSNRMQWFLMEDLRLHWGAGPKFTFAETRMRFGQWSHVAWSHTATGDSSVAYVNGREIHKEKDMGPVIPTGEPMYFGDMGVLPGNNPKQQNFEGVIDEIGFWNRTLAADEVEEVFDKGLKKILAVSARGKMAITWAAVKAGNELSAH